MGMPRTRAVISLIAATVCGMCISSIHLVFIAVSVYRERRLKYMFEEAPPLEIPIDAVHFLLVPAVAGGVNGLVGAIDGLESKSHRPWRALPGLVLLLFMPLWELCFRSRIEQEVQLACVAAVLLGGFVWIGGRVVQRIGIAGSRNPDE